MSGRSSPRDSGRTRDRTGAGSGSKEAGRWALRARSRAAGTSPAPARHRAPIRCRSRGSDRRTGMPAGAFAPGRVRWRRIRRRGSGTGTRPARRGGRADSRFLRGPSIVHGLDGARVGRCLERLDAHATISERRRDRGRPAVCPGTAIGGGGGGGPVPCTSPRGRPRPRERRTTGCRSGARARAPATAHAQPLTHNRSMPPAAAHRARSDGRQPRVTARRRRRPSRGAPRCRDRPRACPVRSASSRRPARRRG